MERIFFSVLTPRIYKHGKIPFPSAYVYSYCLFLPVIIITENPQKI